MHVLSGWHSGAHQHVSQVVPVAYIMLSCPSASKISQQANHMQHIAHLPEWHRLCSEGIECRISDGRRLQDTVNSCKTIFLRSGTHA